jgi:O-antigen/teichoic acid export membrane protein
LSTTGATLVGGGLALGLSILVARLLTPEQNGHYSQFVLVLNLLYIGLNFGLGPTSTFFVASQRASVRSVTKMSLAVLIVLTCLVLTIGWSAYHFGFAQAVESGLKIPTSILYMGFLAGLLLLSCNQVLAILMGAHRYDLVNILSVSRAALPLMLVGIVTAWSPSLSAVIAAHSVGLGLALALAVWVFSTSLSGKLSETQPEPVSNWRSMFGYGGLVYASSLLHYLAVRGLLLLVSYYSAPESVGFLSLALLLLEVTLLLPSAVGQLVFPQSSAPAFDHDALNMVLRVNLYISMALLLLIFFFAEPVVVMLMGRSYAPVAHALVHLSPSVVLLAVPRILSQMLSGQGHPRYPLIAAALSLTSGILIGMWAIPRWDFVGAAWVTNLVSAITCVVTLLGYSRVHGLHVRQILGPRLQDWLGMQRLAMKLVGR